MKQSILIAGSVVGLLVSGCSTRTDKDASTTANSAAADLDNLAGKAGQKLDQLGAQAKSAASDAADATGNAAHDLGNSADHSLKQTGRDLRQK